MKLLSKLTAVAVSAVLTLSLTGCSPLAMGIAVLVVPAAIGMASSNPGSVISEADAAQINNACKEYYAGVTNGMINSSDKYAPNAPAKGSSAQQRRSAANKATVHDALVYAGLQSYENKLSKLGVDLDGTIIDKTNVNFKLKLSSISKNTTLSEIFN